MTDPERVVDLPDGPLQIFITGRKGQGKTECAWLLWNSYPGDRIVIDVNGDVLKNHPEDQPVDLDLDAVVGGRWPEYLKPEPEDPRLSLRYVPDHLVDEKLYHEDLDRVVGLAFAHRGTMLWIDEIGEVAPVGKVGPHTRRALHMGRHQDLYLLMTGPRPITVDPLVLAQADVDYVYDLPNPDDRRRVSDAIGWDRVEFDDEVKALRDHEYLRYVAAAHELSTWPPLPIKTSPNAATGGQRLAEAHMEGPAA